MWVAQPGSLGTLDHLLPGGTPSPADPAPRCWHRTGTGPAPSLPLTWIGPATWEPPRHGSAATLLLPGVSRCPHASSCPATSSPAPRGTMAGGVGCVPRGHRARVGCRQPAASSCPGTSGQPGVFGAGRWSQAAPRSLALPGSIPGQVSGGQSATGALPQHPAQNLCHYPGDTGTGRRNGIWEQRDSGVLALAPLPPPTEAQGWAPPCAASRTPQELNAAVNERKTSSEAKSSLEELGGGGCRCPAAPEEQWGWGSARLRQPQAEPPPTPSSW